MINSILFALFFFSLMAFLSKLIDFFSMPNQYVEAINERTELVEKMRVDLIKEKIKADYFSLKYFLITNDKTGIMTVRNDLEQISVSPNIIYDITKLDQFVKDIFTNKITITFNSQTKKFLYKYH